MKTCDLCREKVDELKKLNKEYVIEDVHEICNKCLTELDDALLKMTNYYNKIHQKMTRRFMKNLRSQRSQSK